MVTAKHLLRIGLAFLAIAAMGRWLDGNRDITGFALAVGILFSGAYCYVYLSTRRTLQNLRQMTDEDRQRALGSIPDLGYRNKLAVAVAKDLEPVTDGVVERFPFPASVQAEARSAYWLIVVAAVLFGWALFHDLRSPLAVGLAIVAGAVLVACWVWAQRRERQLNSVLEVSSFAISEIFADGHRRTLSFDQALWLRNRPRLERVDLYPAAAPHAGISIHYDRLRFVHALNRIVEHGGFNEANKAVQDPGAAV